MPDHRTGLDARAVSRSLAPAAAGACNRSEWAAQTIGRLPVRVEAQAQATAASRCNCPDSRPTRTVTPHWWVFPVGSALFQVI